MKKSFWFLWFKFLFKLSRRFLKVTDHMDPTSSSIMFIVIPMFMWSWCSGEGAFVPSVPGHVSALQGSCVLLPCSFSPPPAAVRGSSRGSPRGSTTYVDVKLRFRPSFMLPLRTAFSSDPGERVAAEFKGRVVLSGDLNSGDCSLIIHNIKMDDPNTYEISLKDRKGLWGTPNRIRLTITRFPDRPVFTAPPVVMLGQTLVLNCSVKISCPTAPPSLSWVWERGGPEGATKDVGVERVQKEGQTSSFISSLTFTPSELVKPRLRCDVLYPGNKRNSSAHNINIHFPPVDVSVEIRTEWVREGGSVLMECVCKADPPITEYRWFYTHLGILVPLPHHSHTTRLHNITRHTRVQCSVRNAQGHAKSPLTSINVEYAPVIVLNQSMCVWDGQVQECVCTVDSNPRPLMTWSVNGSTPPTSFNMTSSYTHHTLQEILRGHTHTPLHTTCYVINRIGNDTHTLMQATETSGRTLQALISVGFLLLLFISLFFTVFVCLCRRRAGRRRQMGDCGPPVCPDSTGVYQERLPLYINCSEVTHIYTNGSYQLVYQNCTPCFIQTKQIHKRQRRQARRQRHRQLPAEQTPAHPRERDTRLTFSPDSDTAVYVEVI